MSVYGTSTGTVMTVDKVRSLMTTAMGDVFTNRGKAVDPQYKKWAREFKTKHAVLIDMDIAYFGEAQRRGSELEPIFYDEITFGQPRITEANQYAMGFKVSKSALQKLAAAPFGEFSSAKIAAVKTLMEKMMDSVENTKEYTMVDILQNITSTSTTARGFVGLGRDSVALCGTHYTKTNPQRSWINAIANETLSASSIDKMVQALRQIPSDEGFPRTPSKKHKLLLGTKLVTRAHEVLKTPWGLDTAYRNENVVASRNNIEILDLVHLGSTYDGYTLVGEDHGIGYFAPVAPEFDDDYDFDTRGQKYSVYFEFIADYRHAFDVVNVAKTTS